ncbi:Ctr copper transporter [Zychaea mexicana]|uniref:Ctr copper transporter n=1 Tax=Zychaea mexicana TaxID=64656 RepID=UPI0022FDF7C6|nr:Ctr copper transporter [Zychaea mexicana]KAI9489171.1 Ctr copper transporter [Zychaea mexicana]
MLFNWRVKDVCVVFEWWHIHSALGLFLSCAVVFAIAAGYEFLRTKTTELDQTRYVPKDNDELDEEAETLLQRTTSTSTQRISKKQEMLRSTIYAILVAISFWLMLVFMTYNGYLMIAVVLGAGFGHYHTQGRLAASRSLQCH